MVKVSERSKPASIKDVAVLSQVSVPTVSRYLNSRDKVSEEKRERIAKAIQLLNYRPNPIARALVRERTKSVAVLSTNTTLYGQSQTIHGVEQSVREAGYSLNIGVIGGESRDALQQSVQSCLDQNPAGVILLNYDQISNDAYAFLRQDLPIVMVAGDRQKDVSQISMQERQGGYEITRYLLSLGHRTVYHITIPGGGGGYSRLAGWRSACEEAGVPAPTTIDAGWEPESGRMIGRELGADENVTAIFAGNDEIAMGVIRGLNDVGRRVPEDVSVAGFDDHPIAKVWNPALTTIRQNFQQAGTMAFSMLKREIDDVVQGRGRTEHWSDYVQIPGELIVRESVAAAGGLGR